MQTVATVSSQIIRQPRSAAYRKFGKRGILWRFRDFIESTDWDERYLCHRWIDKACLGIIAVSILYFVPFLMPLFLR